MTKQGLIYHAMCQNLNSHSYGWNLESMVAVESLMIGLSNNE